MKRSGRPFQVERLETRERSQSKSSFFDDLSIFVPLSFLAFKDQAEEAFQLYSHVFKTPVEQIIRVKDLSNGGDFSREAEEKIA